VCGFSTDSDVNTYLFYWNCTEAPRIVRVQHIADGSWLSLRWLVACVAPDRGMGFGNIAQYVPYSWVETNQTCSSPPWFNYP
jgi:hypothetical protein